MKKTVKVSTIQDFLDLDLRKVEVIPTASLIKEMCSMIKKLERSLSTEGDSK